MKKFLLLAAVLAFVLAFATACDSDEPALYGGSTENGTAESGATNSAINTTNGSPNVLPALAVDRAFSSLADEVHERMQTTPFVIFRQLADALQYGAVTVDANAYTWWYEDGQRWGDGVRSEFTLHSDVARRQWALDVGAWAEGMQIDLSLLLDPQRLAFGSSLFAGGQYHGITFATFPQDFRNFAAILGMPMADITDITNILEELPAMLQGAGNLGELTELFDALNFYDPAVYTAMVENFLRTAQTATYETQTTVGGQQVTARRVAYEVTWAQLVRFMDEYMEQSMRDFAAADFSALPAEFAEIFTELQAEMQLGMLDDWYFVRSELEQLSGNMTMAFYMGAQGRLLKVDFYVNITDDWGWDDFSLTATLDLGTSATDLWQLFVAVYDEFGAYFTATVAWQSTQIGGYYVNSISMTIDDYGWVETFALGVRWNPTTGVFTFFASGEDSFGAWEDELFGGTLQTDGRTFSLGFRHTDSFGSWGETVIVDISTQARPTIPSPSFVNMGDWGFNFIGELMDAAWRLGIPMGW